MDFHELAERMQSIEATASRLEMASGLADALRAASDDEAGVIAYMLLGTLAPEAEGVEVGLADRMVEELIMQRSGASMSEVEALMAEEGDLGLVAERLWDREGGQVALDAFGPAEERVLTVLEVHERLREIAIVEGQGSQERKMRLALRLLDQASPLEALYLVRFLVGTLRLGVAGMTLLDGAAIAFAEEGDVEEGEDGLPRPPVRFRKALERAYNLTSDIGHVVEIGNEKGLGALESVQITLGKPVRPMLAERASQAEAIFENVGSPALAEYKYDGLRLQAHLSSGRERLFSRRLEDVTGPYPDVVEVLKEALDAEEAVVEGEAVPVDPETGRLREFQAIARRRGRKHDLEEAIREVPIRMYLFDALFVDGEDLTSLGVEERRERLASMVGDHEAVRLSTARTVQTGGALDAFFDEAIEDGAEGVMVKMMGEDGFYRAGARGWRWVKYKKDYVEALADSMDLVIVGAYHGKGRRAGWYGTLLGAAYNPGMDRFETVCKIGTGFTDEDLAGLDDVLGEHKRATKSPDVEAELEPDAWFEPVKVAEIRGAELTRSPVHTACRDDEEGIALRFPRFLRWREDKGARDATTVDEVEAMYHRQTKVDAPDGS